MRSNKKYLTEKCVVCGKYFKKFKIKNKHSLPRKTGKLDHQQLKHKTNWHRKKITCENCRKRYLHKSTW